MLMQQIQLCWFSSSSAESISSTSIYGLSAHTDPQLLRSESTANLEPYTYLPYGSYHARHVFRGWLKAEMQRLLTHSSCPSVWPEECSIFYAHLRNRGYPARAIDSCFRGFNWNQRRSMLAPKLRKRSDDDSFCDQYRGCVFSSRNAPGVDQLRGGISLSLETLQHESAGADIFPPRAFFSVKSALPMGCILRRSQWDVFYDDSTELPNC